MWGFDHLEDQSEFFGGYHSYISCNYNSTVIRTYPKVINSLLYNQIPTTDMSRAKMWVKARQLPLTQSFLRVEFGFLI